MGYCGLNQRPLRAKNEHPPTLDVFRMEWVNKPTVYIQISSSILDLTLEAFYQLGKSEKQAGAELGQAQPKLGLS